MGRHLLRGADAEDLAAAGTALGSEVDDVVGGLDDVQIVLDDEDRVAAVDEAAEDFEKPVHVLKVKAGRRLVEEVEGLASLPLCELAAELDSLRFAARERGRRLAEREVAKADIDEGLNDLSELTVVPEELGGLVDGCLENVGNRLVLKSDAQGRLVVAFAAADFAGHKDVGQKVHLDFFNPRALARLAASSALLGAHVKREAPRGVAEGASLGCLGEHLPHQIEGFGVGRRIGARGPADRLLIDDDHFIDLLETF